MARDLTIETDSIPIEKEWIASKLYISSLYFLTVGVLHLWGYWPTFGINILEYLALTDIIKVTAYPIAFTLIFLAISAYAGDRLAKWPIAKLDAELEVAYTHSERTGLPIEIRKFRKKLNRIKTLIRVAILALGISGVALLVAGSMYAWVFLPPVATWVVSKLLLKSKLAEKWGLNNDGRRILCFALAGIAAYSYSFGAMMSQSIVDGTRYRYVISDFPGNNLKSKLQLRYVGHAGDYLFFYDPSRKATVISKLENEKPLILKQYVKPLEMYSFNDIRAVMDGLLHFPQTDKAEER